MRELYITLTCLGFFFSFFFFSQNDSRKEKCRRQMTQALGFRLEGTRGDEDQAVPAGTANAAGWPGPSPSILGELTGLQGADKKRAGGQTAVPRSAVAPLPWQSAGWKHSRLHVWRPCLQSMGPQGPDRRERQEGPGEGCEFDQGPSWDHGAPVSKGNQGSSLLVSQSASSGRLPAGPHP